MTKPLDQVSPEQDIAYLRRAVNMALEAERLGNLPIGAVITLDARIIAEAGNAVLIIIQAVMLR
jgi:tRNA(Arg) A34 adenosine deaminase TadA